MELICVGRWKRYLFFLYKYKYKKCESALQNNHLLIMFEGQFFECNLSHDFLIFLYVVLQLKEICLEYLIQFIDGIAGEDLIFIRSEICVWTSHWCLQVFLLPSWFKGFGFFEICFLLFGVCLHYGVSFCALCILQNFLLVAVLKWICCWFGSFEPKFINVFYSSHSPTPKCYVNADGCFGKTC